jgi:hypothetical protein
LKRRAEDSGDEDGPSTSAPRSIGQMVEHIGNKQVRSVKYQELKRKEDRRKKAERKKRQAAVQKAIEAGKEPPPKQEPKVQGLHGAWACCMVLGLGIG